MKDGVRAGEQAEVSRQELYEDYVNCYLQLGTEVRPCRDAWLLEKATQYLLKDPDPRGTFTVFPFHQAVSGNCGAPSTDCRELLSAFIKAAELLETLCVNLFLQPWKKEIKTLKTFTGPFVYCLLPVLSGPTIQSVLASIGYLPHTDPPQSEYRLSEDANPDRAMLVGFELLLARVECYHLLELLEKDQLGPQECLEVLQRRVGPANLEEPTERKTTIAQREEEEEEEEEEEKKKEESERKEVPPCLDNRLAVNPQPKPRRHLLTAQSIDQSIMEMQMIYPDLAFRGRPLLSDKPQRASGSRSHSKAVHTASTNNYSDDSEAAELPKRDCTRGTRAAATTVRSRDDGSGPGDAGRSSGRSDSNSGGGAAAAAAAPGDAISSSFSNAEESRVDGELSPPQAISLHITLRAGATAEQSLKPGEPQPMAEPPARAQQQTAGDLHNKRPASPGLPSLSSVAEEQELRELVAWAGQLHVQEAKEEVTGNEGNRRGEENTKKKRRKRERTASTEGEAEEQNLRRPVMETGAAPSHATSRQSDPAETTEQKQPTECPPPADCRSCEGGGAGRQEGEDADGAEPGRGEEEHLAQSYVIVEHHRK